MNTKNKQGQKSEGQKTRQEHGAKKQVAGSGIPMRSISGPLIYQEHERPELRLTR
jgi:hypothetical protein